MDLIWLVGIGALLLIGAVVAGFVLRRAWGDFPTRAGELPHTPPTYQVPSAGDRLPLAGPSAPGTSPESTWAADDSIPDLVPITDPLVRRSAEQALERSSSISRYVVRQGDQIYFTFNAIADPIERQAAYELMRRFNAGEQVDIAEAIRLIQRMSRE